MSKTLKAVLGGVLGLVVLVSAGTFVYIHFVEGSAPKKLSLNVSTTGTTAAGGNTSVAPVDLSGTWTATTASQVGYRVNEILFGQTNTAVGRTHNVTGTMVIDGTTVSRTELAIDMASVTSDQTRRDSQFRGRIMEVATFPTASFKLTAPISLPATTGTVKVAAHGDLTLHGTSKPVVAAISAATTPAGIEVSGSIPIVFADYGIGSPSFGPVSTDDHGVLEFLVVFKRS